MAKTNTAESNLSDAVDSVIEATASNAANAKTIAAQSKVLKTAGFRQARPWYELGIGTGFGRMAEGKPNAFFEGALQVLAVPSILVAAGFATGLIPVPSRAGAVLGD